MIGAVSNLFGSVMLRLALIFGALAIMTGTAIAIAWLVFQSIASNMQMLSQERLPELRSSAGIVQTADEIKAVLTSALIAGSSADLDILGSETAALLDDIRMRADAFPQEKSEAIIAKISRVEKALSSLKSARKQMFASDEAIAETVRAAMVASDEAVSLLTTQTNSAYFNLVLGGNDAVSSVEQTLTQLIDQDFALYQTTLEAQSEVNLLSGMALTASQTRDRALQSILEDVGNSSIDRLENVIERLSASATTAELSKTIAAAVQTFRAALTTQLDRGASNEILTVRQSVMAALSSVYDDIYFDLVINSDDAKSANERTIRQLMDVQVGNIRAQAALDSAAKTFIARVMQTALSQTESDLTEQSAALATSATDLQAAMEGATPEVRAAIEPILAIADATDGIAAIKQQAFDASRVANSATQEATGAVSEIATTIAAFSSTAQTNIADTAQALAAEVATARDRMMQVGTASILLVILAPLLIWRMIAAPLNRVTAATERLASGDLSEITGLDRQKGEIGRMSDALHVFRAGALDRIRLQEDEKERDAKALQAEREAAQARQDAAEKERLSEEARREEVRVREAEEQKRAENARRATEAERAAHAAEQEAVVNELAGGLRLLSAGDFTHQINAEFPGSYETLRHDYNAAIRTLAELVQTITQSAGTIDASSSEIAASSLDLSRRTENAAATLEETAAALSELTASVASAAKGASSASDTVKEVKANAQSSHGVMQEAVAAMTEIESSSSKISKILEVIDSIAFQTNLLALNAGVEAARAGEAGRGFAVVASEVRLLAHRCSEAATQINALISESAGHVGTGVERMDQTRKALDLILSGIVNMSKSVNDIAVSAREQSGGIAEINTAVEQLDRSTQQNAAMFEETTAASQSLTSEASDLASLVAGFKTPRSECTSQSVVSEDATTFDPGQAQAAQ